MGRLARYFVAALLVAVACAGVVLVSSALAEIGAVKDVAEQFVTKDAVLVSSREGRPIVSAERMLPGQRTRGLVKVKNKGGAPGVLWLVSRHKVDSRGRNDGALSDKLTLIVRRIGRGGRAVTVWKGNIRAQTRARIGYLRPGESRRYRFTVIFQTRPPARGYHVDNLYMGSRYSTDFVFKLVPVR